ncbi:MAG: crossover junction endodeoxyribonuclease RuvC [Candidatus Alcyoniella australis]|nr:crossover junction endodeoxyribonuclease RuvC [Candidatus Alcyoniella australis]
MIFLGIDPGSLVTGWGIVEEQGSRLRHIDNGLIQTTPGSSFAQRLDTIHGGLVQVIALHAPDEAACERIFYSKNVQSAFKLGEARGVAVLAAAQAGLEVFEYTPAEVKKALVGYGRAEKRQVARMVTSLLSLPGEPAEDAADALAVAICHINSRKLKSLGR